jgi:glutamate racemase
VGGLTVLSEIRRRLPAEATVYLGDNARTPYGPRPADEVRTFTIECVRWLLGQDVKALVLACNTATSRALADARVAAPVPVLGVVRPGAVSAAAATRSGHVGVIATAGTVESGAYPEAIGEANPDLVVSQQACPDLVPLVEAGELDGARTTAAVDGYLDELLAADDRIDTLLLGCTHYPLLRPIIAAQVGERVAIVDSATATASALAELLAVNGLEAPGTTRGTAADAGLAGHERPDEVTGPVSHVQLTTGDAARFREVAGRLFGDAFVDVGAVELAGVLS